MSELPCVGAGITVVDPGPNTNEVFNGRSGRPYSPHSPPKRKRKSHWLLDSSSRSLRLLRAYVTEVNGPGDVVWTCGKRTGSVLQGDCGRTWIIGHGPQARGALLAARALENQR